MYIALGLLTAGLLALAIAPAIWRRADRLARARVESDLPLSLTEIQAEKDQLRAGFAVSARRLEMKVEQLEANANGQLLEISRSRTEIARLEADRNAKAETIEALEARGAELVSELRAAELRITEANAEISRRDNSLAEQKAAITGLEAELAKAQVLTEEQKMELVARDTTIGNLNDSLAASKAAEAQTGLARDKLAESLAEEQAAHATERRRAAGLEARITAFEAERVDRLATLERRSGEVKSLQAELAAERVRRESIAAEIAQLEAERTERLRELTRRSEEVESLKATLQRTADTAAEASVVGGDGDNVSKAISALEVEKHELAARLAALEDDHASLRAENDELRRTSGADWEAQRAEDQRIRERLTEVASTVVAMARAGEEPATPLAPVAAEETAAPHGNGNGEHGNGHGEAAAKGATDDGERDEDEAPPRQTEGSRPVARTLAERIRSLQRAPARPDAESVRDH